MAATADTATATATVVDSSSAEELAAKAVHKRYEGLIMVRTKAVKGKGAWYWVHLEPMLAYNNETGLPKAVKLRCLLCNAVFSASNPSRTASEHLKRGTCPNFNTHIPKPISSISPPSNNRKRPPDSCHDDVAVLPRQQNQQQLVLSGGKEDLGALALLEDSVKRLRSPKTSPGPALSKSQIECAFHFLSDWVYESCGAVSFSSLDHPKFRAFMNQVGMPVVSKREFIGPRLDVKYEEVKAESEARIGDAMFFQVASDGWKLRSSCGNYCDGVNLVNLSVNLPNGTSLYRQAIFVGGLVPSKYVEEVLWETITGICGNGGVQRCVGIVADRFKATALRNLENQNYWMVNLSCQLQGFISLIKDFSKELPLFRSVIDNCFKVANFFNNKTQIRRSFSKYQMQEYGHSNSGLLRVPFNKHCDKDFEPVYAMLEDILSSARAFHLVLMDESYKVVEMEDAVASEVADMVGGVDFWNQLEVVHSLIKLIKEMAREIEAEKPLVGQCLPLWNELRAKVKDWCLKFHITEGAAEKVIERRFNKNYHPAWSAAYVLDPRYLIRDSSGKYLPPFKLLNSEQEKDVDRLITRLVSREEAHVALMELMKWRTEGLDSVYAKAVQMKERDPTTGKIRIVNPQSGRLVWETYLTKFKALGKVAVRLIFLHATSCGFKCNPSLLRWVCSHGHSRIGMEKAQKLIFVAANSKLERRESSSEEVNDADLFALANGEDDVLNEVYVDTSSV